MKIWQGIITQNFRLQCHILPLNMETEEAPAGLAFFRSHLNRVENHHQILEKTNLTPVAGDLVDYTRTPENDLLILKIHPRKNSLARQEAGSRFIKRHVVAANIDGIMICQSISHPLPNARFIDRLLVFAEKENFSIMLIWTKIDLLKNKNQKSKQWKSYNKIISIYHPLPYSNLFINNYCDKHQEDQHNNSDHQTEIPVNLPKDEFDKLMSQLQEKRWVIVGNSGVGKSTLIQRLTKDPSIKIGEISEKIEKGRHTTTQAKLYSIPTGGEIIDTAGLREFGLSGINASQICNAFREFARFQPGCKLPDCSHEHEPQCGIIEAVEKGLISMDRYHSYLNIRSSLNELPSWKKNRPRKGKKRRTIIDDDEADEY